MFGADPEFFILDNGMKPVPAWKLFPPKHAALTGNTPNTPYYHGGAIFRDGYAVELNVRPAYCRTELARSTWSLLKATLSYMPEGYTLSTQPAIAVDLADMSDAPEDCKVFGCDPSLSAYSDDPVLPNIDAMSHPWRYAGGHMHFAVSIDLSENDKRMFVKLLDLFVGLPLAYIFNDDANRTRRQFYGRAGEYRLQKYAGGVNGVEYRVPSPQIWNSNKVSNLAFGVGRAVYANLKPLIASWRTSWENDLQEQINNCDVSEAWLQRVQGLYTPELLKLIRKLPMMHRFLLRDATVMPSEYEGYVDWVVAHHANARQLLGIGDYHEDKRPITQDDIKYGTYRVTPAIQDSLLKAA